jgi:uncharacterized RDD family membrane protein YckC
MVFIDLSGSDVSPGAVPELRVASPLERLVAFFFDLALLGPVFGLALGFMVKSLQQKFFTSPESTEFKVLLGVFIGSLAVLTLLAQTFFLYFKGATPGKWIFKMRVVATNGEKLTLTQCFERSFFWLFQWTLFALPFLEVLGQKHRRALHDRCAETIVITQKNEVSDLPHPIEVNFVRQTMALVYLGLVVMSITALWSFFSDAHRGLYKQAELRASGYLCENGSSSQDRIDFALAKFLLGDTDEKCLLQEADFIFWTQNTDLLPWANLAKGIVFNYETKKRNAYFKQACADEKSMPCAIVKQLRETEKVGSKNFSSFTSQVLSLQSYWEAGNYSEHFELLQSLLKKFPQSDSLNAAVVRNYWKTNQLEKAYGAFSLVTAQARLSSRQELQTWLCLEEVYHHCSANSGLACQALRKEFMQGSREALSEKALIALVKDKSCSGHPVPQLTQFQKQLTANPDLYRFINVTSNKQLNPERRVAELQDLASSAKVGGDIRDLAKRELEVLKSTQGEIRAPAGKSR